MRQLAMKSRSTKFNVRLKIKTLTHFENKEEAFFVTWKVDKTKELRTRARKFIDLKINFMETLQTEIEFFLGHDNYYQENMSSVIVYYLLDNGLNRVNGAFCLNLAEFLNRRQMFVQRQLSYKKGVSLQFDLEFKCSTNELLPIFQPKTSIKATSDEKIIKLNQEYSQIKVQDKADSFFKKQKQIYDKQKLKLKAQLAMVNKNIFCLQNQLKQQQPNSDQESQRVKRQLISTLQLQKWKAAKISKFSSELTNFHQTVVAHIAEGNLFDCISNHIFSLNQQFDTQFDQLVAVKSQSQQALNQVNWLNAENKNTQKQIDRLEKQINRLVKQVQASQNSSAQLKQQNQTLRVKVISLTSQLMQSEGLCDKYNDLLQKAKEQRLGLQLQNQAAINKNSFLQQKNDGLISQVNKLNCLNLSMQSKLQSQKVKTNQLMTLIRQKDKNLQQQVTAWNSLLNIQQVWRQLAKIGGLLGKSYEFQKGTVFALKTLYLDVLQIKERERQRTANFRSIVNQLLVQLYSKVKASELQKEQIRTELQRTTESLTIAQTKARQKQQLIKSRLKKEQASVQIVLQKMQKSRAVSNQLQQKVSSLLHDLSASRLQKSQLQKSLTQLHEYTSLLQLKVNNFAHLRLKQLDERQLVFLQLQAQRVKANQLMI